MSSKAWEMKSFFLFFWGGGEDMLVSLGNTESKVKFRLVVKVYKKKIGEY